MTVSIVDTFLQQLYVQAPDGSHIITVVGVEHVPNSTVFQRYRGEDEWEEHFRALFQAVQDTLDNGELCIILVRSLLGNGPGNAATVLLRAWTLTPVGIIPVSAQELAAQSAGDPLLDTVNAEVVFANGWDQDLDAFDN